MDAGLRTPLLDTFRRGVVARDLRELAARGALAPRPLEQLGLLALLTTDEDGDIRDLAEQTLTRIPLDALAAFIARSDVPLELREFFVRRGLSPAATPAPDTEAPLVGDGGPAVEDEAEDTDASSVAHKVANMSVLEKVKAAIKGSREMRAILIRDPNKMVASAVLSSPKLTEQEVETISRMPNVSEDILRTIGQTRGWIKNYNIAFGLVRNPKAPLALTLTLLHRLNDRDLRGVSIDRNVPEPLRIAARKKVVLEQKR
jgi:hypothetical protein